ncbi:MAG TPA: tetratricopeptide repeat protein, partial [Blastocatellia bacterium]|nr:tetratricopeptide repeat protein [Blastocatellia bacterium]
YGFALYASAVNLKDAAERKAVRVKARNVILKAKKLGFDDPLADTLIQAIPLDGSDVAKFSKNPDADKLMSEGEGAFTQGKMDEALKNYQKALEFDPKLYEAALFCGDVYVHKGDFAQAEVWYQKAIAIDPLRETGYRYSATPLMKQGKTDLARDRYIEAYISEPYNKLAVRGLTQWAEATRTQIAHPKIDIPTDVKFDEKGDAKINLDAGALLNGANDGSVAWIAYGASRADWRKEKFAKTFPNEKEYRHSLAEEADALRSVIAIATADKKVKTLSPSLAKLKKLNDEGLLEAYILLAQADEGIAKDFPDYLKQNRDKLRRYATEYILTGGGR